MKTNLYTSFVSAAIFATLLAGCSATTNDDKKSLLEKKKAEQAKLATEISKLEAEVAKDNPETKLKSSRWV